MEYRVASIFKYMGFGISVIQRLVKTSAKKNLYWEIKEKVVEESFNGIRMDKNKKRVRVYGLDSTRDVRARLIELLQERVRYHKDKFVAPIILDEMKHMVVKKSGKVEHSDNSHDDQVFSYLMALYVWYDGKNLAENFNITKNTIKTDTEEELLDNDVEFNGEKTAGVDNIDGYGFEDEYDEIADAIAFLESNSHYVTTQDMRDQEYLDNLNARNSVLNKNKDLREKLAKETGLDPSMFEDKDHFGQTSVTLSPDLFDMDYYGDDQEYSVLQGNLSSFWDQV